MRLIILNLFITAAFALAASPAICGAPAPALAFEPQRTARNGAGKFKVEYPPVKKKEYAAFQNELKKERALESIVSDLNSTFALPSDITVSFNECGEANAFYDPQEQRISICYELIEGFYAVFRDVVETENELDDAVIGAAIFVFFHELGHALVHVLELPVTGKEEDAVDQLSLFILTDGSDDGEKAALDGALALYLEAQSEDADVENLPFWGEHSLGQQRFYNIVCGVFGQNPQKYSALVKDGVLPEERAERCEAEYQQIERSWSKLLAPHVKTAAK